MSRTDKSFVKIRDAIEKGALASKSMEKIAIRGSAGESRCAQFANLIVGGWVLTICPNSQHVGAAFKFQCKADKGAVLMMNHSADLEVVHGSRSLVKYLETRWDDWLEHIQSAEGLDIEVLRRPGLMFISGFHKTVDWAMVYYASGGRSAEFLLSADAGGASCAFSLSMLSSTQISPSHRWGPHSRSGSTSSEAMQPGYTPVSQHLPHSYRQGSARLSPVLRDETTPESASRRNHEGRRWVSQSAPCRQRFRF